VKGLYRHRFEGPIDSLMGSHQVKLGRDGLKMRFHVEVVGNEQTEVAD
jgi:hypothetical protein